MTQAPLLGPSPFCFSFWSFLLLFSAGHMLQRRISACRICLFRVDLLPLMLAKMCQLCLFFLPARFLLDFCSFARFLLAVCSTRALQRSWLWCLVWHSVHNFTVSCVWCFGAVLYIFVLARYSYYNSSMYDNGNIQHASHKAYMYFRLFFGRSGAISLLLPYLPAKTVDSVPCTVHLNNLAALLPCTLQAALSSIFLS